MLHLNQEFLGRTILILNSHKQDPHELSTAEQKELFQILSVVNKLYTMTFKPDKLNYSILGNEVDHLHIHIIPRYQKSVTFQGKTFEDLKYGKNPYPYDKNFHISPELLQQIKEKLSSTFNS